jgi:hypothetical protein
MQALEKESGLTQRISKGFPAMDVSPMIIFSFYKGIPTKAQSSHGIKLCLINTKKT